MIANAQVSIMTSLCKNSAPKITPIFASISTRLLLEGAEIILNNAPDLFYTHSMRELNDYSAVNFSGFYFFKRVRR